jgi:OOP family OmpA-OmpF porin
MLRLVSLSALVLFLAPGAQAELEGPQITLSPYAGTTIWDDDLGLKDKLIYGGRAGLFMGPWLGIEGTYGLSTTETEVSPSYDTDMEHIGADLVFNFLPFGRVNPYLTGGWSQLRYDSDSDNPAVDPGPHYFQGWEFGGGLKILLVQGDQTRLDLRLDARDVYTNLTPSFDEFGDPEDYRHNLLLTAGLQFAVGFAGKDSDKDGVKNRQDLCPETPLGATVDPTGCPLDGDSDGVFDGLDDCPGTPIGAVVDALGCPQDSDGDGIFDGIDQCTATPAGAKIDAKGCPLDGDGDGVFDGLDKCTGTPPGATVNAQGCPQDSDGDGVFDGIDECPGTAANLRVDQKGCPIEITETEIQLLDTGMIRSTAIRFESGKANLQAESFAELDEIGRTLANWPELRIEIGGHTDSQGSEAYNKKLSERRAQAVLDYLTLHFPNIRVGQYTIAGYGESQPIATNDTAQGRAQNRRVEFKVLNMDELKRVIERRKQLEK